MAQVHPDALETKMSPRQLQMLQDPFFQGRDNADLVDVAVDGVPGADPHVFRLCDTGCFQATCVCGIHVLRAAARVVALTKAATTR